MLYHSTKGLKWIQIKENNLKGFNQPKQKSTMRYAQL